jgi:hypothetical protein
LFEESKVLPFLRSFGIQRAVMNARQHAIANFSKVKIVMLGVFDDFELLEMGSE